MTVGDACPGPRLAGRVRVVSAEGADQLTRQAAHIEVAKSVRGRPGRG